MQHSINLCAKFVVVVVVPPLQLKSPLLVTYFLFGDVCDLRFCSSSNQSTAHHGQMLERDEQHEQHYKVKLGISKKYGVLIWYLMKRNFNPLCLSEIPLGER